MRNTHALKTVSLEFKIPGISLSTFFSVFRRVEWVSNGCESMETVFCIITIDIPTE